MIILSKIKFISISLSMLLGAMVLIGSVACTNKQEKAKELDSDVNKIVEKLNADKKSYVGKLTPKDAALITHEVSTQSMKAFPVGSEIPKDPKELLKLNEEIRKKNEEIYKKHGTSMDEVTQYISQLTPKDRENYNQILSELFLEQSRKKYGEQNPEVKDKANEKKGDESPKTEEKKK